LWNAIVENNEIRDNTGYDMITSPSIVQKISNTNVVNNNTQSFVVAGGTIKNNITWPIDSYIILGTIAVDHTEPASLTLLSGTELLMTPQSNIVVGSASYNYGHLIADGVTFINYTAEPWGKIEIRPSMEQEKNSITNCTIDGGGYTQWDYESGMIYLYKLGSTNLPTISGNTLKNSINYAISTYSTTIDVSNNTFTNNALGETFSHN